MNEPGLTHLSLSVDDVDAVCARVPEYGGEVVESSNIGAAVFVRDPDGQLLELLPMTYRKHLESQGLPLGGHAAVEALPPPDACSCPPADQMRAVHPKRPSVESGAAPSHNSQSCPLADVWNATLRSRVGAMNPGCFHACGRWPTANSEGRRGSRTGPRRSTDRRRWRWAGSATSACHAAARGPSGGHSVSNSIGFSSRLFQKGNGGCASRGAAHRPTPARPAAERRARIVSSCSSPSTSPTLHAIASRIGRSSWVISIRCAATVRPRLRVVTSNVDGAELRDAQVVARERGRTQFRVDAPAARNAHAAT